MSRLGIGSSVLVRGGDGAKGKIMDIVLCTNEPDHSLVAYVYVSFEGGKTWQGGSHWLIPDPDALHLTFDEHEHRTRLVQKMNVNTGKPLHGSDQGATAYQNIEV